MSFTISREYPRAILRPLQLVSTAGHEQPRTIKSPSLPETPSLAWRATSHVFSGTKDRDAHPAWPSSSFEQDPELIPDDDKYNIHYDPESTTSRRSIYHMYDQSDSQKTSEVDLVPPPLLAAKRYIPIQNAQSADDFTRDKMTLLMLPGMGVPKEMFEPFLETLLLKLHGTNTQIDEIWTLDMPSSGQTALLNPRGYLYGNEKDITRDILLFVTAYLPLTAAQVLPEQLVARQPTLQGPQPVRRNVHVLAHSLGAQCAILAAAHAPDIFASLTVMDPAMIPSGKINKAFTKLPKDTLCTNLRYSHPSLDSVVTDLRTNKRTRGWDKRVIDIFTRRGVIPDSKGFRLIAHPRLEWALYYDKETPAQCFDRLTNIKVPLHTIMPTRPFAVPPKQLETIVGGLSQPTKITWIANTTHQLPLERPDECADAAASWLASISQKTLNRARL
ncbi:hypothetical protein N7452_010984 [Penicillium brevicompactum]|uniref:AB hydrolase-1 domain-containing protein n=1 Tax=Penicillium brevicompactum TaxID=5074 RepID=A0A9W9Q173_PENBR|nr:hypothetical protein N7452_010984 [Penicillium brevicompactum]